jgi:CRISPR-associated protein Cmx8
MPETAPASATPKRLPRAKKKDAPVGPLTVRWNLAELPSSQHKAGLAGLALCVAFLRRRAFEGTCEIEAIDPGGLTLRVDRAGMQALFDDVYAASNEEQEREKAFKHKATKEDVPPKRTIEKTVVDKKGVEKVKTFYVYDQTVPRGGLVDEWDAAAAGGPKLWLKLWRDLVWTTLRGVPATREPYNCRAEKRIATDGEEAWDALATAPESSVELPSTYFLGAQARTAENASFKDLAKFQTLLHFWPFVVPIYVPSVVDRDGVHDFVGYALVVPEIVDLQGFVEEWPQVVRGRSSSAFAYLPRDAVIEVAGEAGLDIAHRALQVIGRSEGATATRPWLDAVDVFHIEKEGNNVRVRSVLRVDLRRDRADLYARIRTAYWSSTFRRLRVLNVLDDVPWWQGFGRMCATTTHELTIHNPKFRHDCRIAFTEIEMKEATGTTDPKSIEQLIYQAARTYVLGRLAAKYNLKWDAGQAANPAWKKDFEDKKEKIAREAFLAIRSRTGADFVTYFTSTICAIPQHLGESGYLEVARALQRDSEIEKLRSLTLLALSANS